MSPDVRIDRAGPQDLDAVLALLAEHKLPPDGLSEHLATTFVARDAGRVTGSAALEAYADGALLRREEAPSVRRNDSARRIEVTSRSR